MTDFETLLTRICAVNREKFGPGARTKGVQEHIKKEFDEINSASGIYGRQEEWVDVAILGIDGLLRACREVLRDTHPGTVENIFGEDHQSVFDGEPSNEVVAKYACRALIEKINKNELRDFGDWRQASPDAPMEHKRGTHD